MAFPARPGRAGWHALLGAASAAAGLLLASHHPLSPGGALAAWLAWAALSWARPAWWLVALPALLPVASLAPWTGWIALDEFDGLVLASAAGLHAHLAREAAAGRVVPPLPSVARWVAALLGGWTLLALGRGMVDAGGTPGWFDGYLDPLNAWRVAKPVVWSLLLLPGLWSQLQAAPRAALARLRTGMLAGLALVVAAVLWERAAVPGLLDFSASYRTVALFWEMHVGGAAIDAYLALAVPFVLWALWRLRQPLPWCAAAALACGAAYAALTTFSRGVFLAVGAPLALPLAWFVAWRAGRGRLRGLMQAAVVVAAVTALLVWAATALELAGVAALLAAWLVAALVAWRLTGIGWRAVAGATLAVALVAQVAAVLYAGSFLRERVQASRSDLLDRAAHWRRGVSLLQAPEQWALGLGAGRLPAHYAQTRGQPGFGAVVHVLPGVARFQGAPDGSWLQRPFAYALTQRVALQPGPYRLVLQARALAAGSQFWARVCESHLLTDRRCQSAAVTLQGDAGWQTLELQLHGPRLAQDALPRMGVLALSVPRGAVELRWAALYAGGEQLLANGAFREGRARWWPRAQEHFLPWHLDNLYLEQLVERGVPGLALFLVLVGLAGRRLVRALHDRDEAVAEAAPFLGASLCGVLLVGLVSSVMDMPRVAWLLWLLLWLCALLPLRPALSAAPRQG